MIVFGDTLEQVTVAARVDALRARLACRTTAAAELDGVRRLVIEAGCLEQAVADAHEEGALAAGATACAEAATDAAAELFIAALRALAGRPPEATANAQHRLEDALQALAACGRLPITVRTPEGFAYYTLFPEQYCVAARAWSADHAADPDRQVVVAGIRSIGTTLSAVVRAALAAEGWDARRLTVRPTGPSTARTARLRADRVGTARWALVADEGPGLSGSSMAAVAAALAAHGIAPSRIAFLPSHRGEPGALASEATRRWWSATPRYVAEPDALRWGCRSLTGLLAEATVESAAPRAAVERIDDAGGGAWRGFVYPSRHSWPAVDLPFERTKYRCVLADGRCVLWKFQGTEAERTFAVLRERSEQGWCPEPWGIAHGFVAVPWLAGAVPRSGAPGAATIRALARYAADAAGPPAHGDVHAAGVQRLAEMLYWNVWEGLGPEVAERACVDIGGAAGGADSATYGDGRMAPQEWRSDGRGGLRKLAAAATCDHTVIGVQSVAWDIAGALIEWDLDGARAGPAAGRGGALSGLPAPGRRDPLSRMRLRRVPPRPDDDDLPRGRRRVAAGRTRARVLPHPARAPARSPDSGRLREHAGGVDAAHVGPVAGEVEDAHGRRADLQAQQKIERCAEAVGERSPDHVAVRHEGDRRVSVLLPEEPERRDDTGLYRDHGLTAGSPVTAPEGVPLLPGPRAAEIVERGAGPLAVVDLAEVVADLHRQAPRLGERPRRLQGALHRA